MDWGRAAHWCCDGSSGQQGDSAIHSHVSFLPQTPLPPRRARDSEQSSLCYSRSLLAIHFILKYLFIYFWLGRVLAVAQGLPSSCGSAVAAWCLCCPVACEILVPWPGIWLTSPALEGGFLTTGLPGKFPVIHFKYSSVHRLIPGSLNTSSLHPSLPATISSFSKSVSLLRQLTFKCLTRTPWFELDLYRWEPD